MNLATKWCNQIKFTTSANEVETAHKNQAKWKVMVVQESSF